MRAGEVICLKLPHCLLAFLALWATFGFAGQVPPARVLSRGGTIRMLGDSIFDCHEGNKRVEVVMQHVLERNAPSARWTIYYEAFGGDLGTTWEQLAPKTGQNHLPGRSLRQDESTG